jgi:hypothetical protein
VSDKPDQDKKPQEPQRFDWVTKRSLCSLPNVFKDLMLQVEQDVKVRNGLRPANSPYEFSLAENGDTFTIFLKSKDLEKSVTFKLGEHSILVEDDKGKELLEVTLKFSDQAECRLIVNETERENWQVRRMALEGLMFHKN